MKNEILNMAELSPEEQKAITQKFINEKIWEKWKPFKIDNSGTDLLRDEISNYLNNWENATIDGLKLRQLQCDDFLGIVDEILTTYHDKLNPPQIEELKKDRELFEIFLRRIETKIEYRKSKTPNLAEPIIGKEYLTLIFKKYKDQFNEQKDSWNERFVYPNETTVQAIEIDKRAVAGSNRLVLIAILASIQNTTGNKFDFDKFVLDRFGLKNFEKAKTDHKEKKEFLDVVEACNRILKK